jgi:uncharacterized membrane protein YoaK (UPF0700 family)
MQRDALISRAKAVTASGTADRRLNMLLFVLSILAGATDTVSFLGMAGLFTAHITGNLVVVAARVVAGDPATASHLLSLPIFMVVLLGARLIAVWIDRRGRSPLRLLLVLQLIALVAFCALGVAGSPTHYGSAPLQIMAGMFGVAAMATQNAVTKMSFHDAPSTAVMTANVTFLMLDLGTLLLCGEGAEPAKAKDRALRTSQVIAGFCIGCGLGAAGVAMRGLWSAALPASLALLALALSYGVSSSAR